MTINALVLAENIWYTMSPITEWTISEVPVLFLLQCGRLQYYVVSY